MNCFPCFFWLLINRIENIWNTNCKHMNEICVSIDYIVPARNPPYNSRFAPSESNVIEVRRTDGQTVAAHCSPTHTSGDSCDEEAGAAVWPESYLPVADRNVCNLLSEPESPVSLFFRELIALLWPVWVFICKFCMFSFSKDVYSFAVFTHWAEFRWFRSLDVGHWTTIITLADTVSVQARLGWSDWNVTYYIFMFFARSVWSESVMGRSTSTEGISCGT
jgi:hypothetical protein